MIIDSHCHLDHLSDAALALLRERGEVGEYRALLPGVEPTQWRDACAHFSSLSWVDLALGLHPWHAPGASDGWLGALTRAIEDAGAVAIGEIGVDHLRHRSALEREQAALVFGQQLELARALGLPVVIHCVRAHDEALAIVRAKGAGVRGIVHAYSGSQEHYEAWVRAGFVVGLGALVTSERAKRARAAAVYAREGSFVLETDAPFMRTRAEYEAQEPQGAGAIDEVAAEVAALRGCSAQAVVASAGAAYEALFGRAKLGEIERL